MSEGAEGAEEILDTAINVGLAEEIINIALRYNKSILSVLDFTKARVILTDEECGRLAETTVLSFKAIRRAFKEHSE